ncbi:MAG: hypothetical protein ACRECW_04160 [Phyllobacterium sp.]
MQNDLNGMVDPADGRLLMRSLFLFGLHRDGGGAHHRRFSL